jgi:hypothetical protein
MVSQWTQRKYQRWTHGNLHKHYVHSRFFLELISYYHKFIAQYGEVARPLTALLKKDAFSWSPAADRAFMDLKHFLKSASLLHLPEFDKKFIVECDASRFGFGVVLCQGDGLVAFSVVQWPPITSSCQHMNVSLLD